MGVICKGQPPVTVVASQVSEDVNVTPLQVVIKAGFMKKQKTLCEIYLVNRSTHHSLEEIRVYVY